MSLSHYHSLHVRTPRVAPPSQDDDLGQSLHYGFHYIDSTELKATLGLDHIDDDRSDRHTFSSPLLDPRPNTKDNIPLDVRPADADEDLAHAIRSWHLADQVFGELLQQDSFPFLFDQQTARNDITEHVWKEACEYIDSNTKILKFFLFTYDPDRRELTIMAPLALHKLVARANYRAELDTHRIHPEMFKCHITLVSIHKTSAFIPCFRCTGDGVLGSEESGDDRARLPVYVGIAWVAATVRDDLPMGNTRYNSIGDGQIDLVTPTSAVLREEVLSEFHLHLSPQILSTVTMFLTEEECTCLVELLSRTPDLSHVLRMLLARLEGIDIPSPADLASASQITDDLDGMCATSNSGGTAPDAQCIIQSEHNSVHEVCSDNVAKGIGETTMPDTSTVYARKTRSQVQPQQDNSQGNTTGTQGVIDSDTNAPQLGRLPIWDSPKIDYRPVCAGASTSQIFHHNEALDFAVMVRLMQLGCKISSLRRCKPQPTLKAIWTSQLQANTRRTISQRTFKNWNAMGCKFAWLAGGGTVYVLVLVVMRNLRTTIGTMDGHTANYIGNILRWPDALSTDTVGCGLTVSLKSDLSDTHPRGADDTTAKNMAVAPKTARVPSNTSASKSKTKWGKKCDRGTDDEAEHVDERGFSKKDVELLKQLEHRKCQADKQKEVQVKIQRDMAAMTAEEQEDDEDAQEERPKHKRSRKVVGSEDDEEQSSTEREVMDNAVAGTGSRG
ncbi:uncharacterized protein B0H18DRAFT_961324 [Fomitopsis serialis]|uniref:uncharacterized protein n=1 Tax=Fomitopsis serialis TaxID=139415 RepID=UPI0020084238|nr:uncharacterized protein B0H18DRAFT_961324 [Neoantrodia serialis]KAH9912170.1 hypothetical protein B0H18DRAFT_961324 [Neoantrodia serialis]